MSSKCCYCNAHLFGVGVMKRGSCDVCAAMVEAHPQIVEWIMRVVQGMIDKELDSHTDRYSHESSSSGYY